MHTRHALPLTPSPSPPCTDLGIVEPGSTIGEAAVLLNQAHTFSARALTPVHVYVLSREALAGLVQAYPALGMHLSADLLAFVAARGGKV